MPPSRSRDHNSWVMTGAVIATAGVFVISLGLMYPLLALILKKQGVSATLIGLNSAMTPLGVILSAPLIPRLAQRLGAGLLALICTALTAVLLLLIGAFKDLWVWFPVRLALGMVINGPYIISETWVNELATSRTRGRIMGFYTTILSAGFALGPFILALTGSDGWAPFGVVITILALTALGLFFARSHLPEFSAGGRGSIRTFLPLVPLLLVGVGVCAFFDQAVLAFLPVYGLHFGLSERIGAVAVGVLISGNVLMQFPIGWATDLLSRRAVMIGCALLTAAGGLVLPMVITVPILLWPLLFFWGAAAFGIYTVALTELGDRFSGSMLLAGNAAFAMVWGLGGILGTPVAGGAMDLVGPHGLPTSLGLLFFSLAAFLSFRRPA